MKNRWRWYHGVGIYLAIQAVSFGLGLLVRPLRRGHKPRLTEQVAGNDDYNEFYNSLKQPSFAPPDWMFAPVWTINNAAAIYGLIRVLNMPRGREGRGEWLSLQTMFWLIFVVFNAVFFGLRSPVLAAIDTNAALALTAGTQLVAAAKLQDQRVFASQLPTLLWLMLAAAVSTTIAVQNEDKFLGKKARR